MESPELFIPSKKGKNKKITIKKAYLAFWKAPPTSKTQERLPIDRCLDLFLPHLPLSTASNLICIIVFPIGCSENCLNVTPWLNMQKCCRVMALLLPSTSCTYCPLLPFPRKTKRILHTLQIEHGQFLSRDSFRLLWIAFCYLRALKEILLRSY